MRRQTNSRTGQMNSSAGQMKRKTGQTASLCSVYGKCGGCDMLDIPYDKQLKNRQVLVEKLLRPFCPVEQITGMDDPWHYRNKVHAVFGRKKDGTIISGTYAEGTHRIVPVCSCAIEDERAGAIIATIRELATSFKIRIYSEESGLGLLRHVLVRTGHESGQVLVALVLTSPVFPSKNNFLKALLARHPDITTVVLNVNDRRTSMVLGERESTLFGRGFIEDTLCGLTFRISSRSFYQVNSLQTEKLYAKAIGLMHLTGRERVIDAYCGIGTIGLTAAGSAGEVIGVELNRDAVKDAIANARANHIRNARFCQADATEFLQEMADAGERADVIVMDPPRSGSTQEFIRSAAVLAPSRIVYVSCNPVTLARDLAVFNKLGYTARTAAPFDMFPMCSDHHVETVVLLSRDIYARNREFNKKNT